MAERERKVHTDIIITSYQDWMNMNGREIVELI